MVWPAFDQKQISTRARAAIAEARTNADGLSICDISLLEFATLASKGRIRLDVTLESFLEEVESGFVVLPIRGRAYARAMGFPASYAKDPADRRIGATALVGGLSLLSADRAIRRARTVQRIW